MTKIFSNKEFVHRVALALIFALGTFFFTIIAIYAVNFPNADDFDVYLNFLNRYKASDHPGEKLSLIFALHNEHYIVTNRLAALLCNGLLGSLNFKILILFGNLSLIVIIWLLYNSFPVEKKRKPLLFLPVVLLFFQPQYAEASLWATTAWAFFYVNVFALLAVIVSCRPGNIVHLWMILLTLATAFTQGNGFFLPITISILFLLKKHWNGAVIWALIQITLLVGLQYKSLSNFMTIKNASMDLRTTLDYAFSFIGSGLAFSNHLVAFILGTVIIIYFLVLCALKYFRTNPVLFGFFLFLLISVGANTLNRVQFDMLPYTPSRYHFVSILLFILVYLSLTEILQDHRSFKGMFLLFCLLAMAFYIASYRSNFNQYRLRHELLTDSMIFWQVCQEGLPYPVEDQGKKIFERALENDIFQPTDGSISNYVSKRVPLNASFEKKSTISDLEHVIETPDLILLKGWAFILNQDSRDRQIYITLEGPYVQYIYETTPRVRPDVTLLHKIHLDQGNLDQSGFLAIIKKDEIIEGDYQVCLIIARDDSAARITTDHSVSIQ